MSLCKSISDETQIYQYYKSKYLRIKGFGITLIAVTFQIFIAHQSRASETTPERVFRQASPVVLSISARGTQGGEKSGSGVIVGKDEILTNCHVVDGARQIEIIYSDKVRVVGSLSNVIGGTDLCILVAETGSKSYARLGSSENLRVGQAIFAIGNPLSLSSTLSAGIISGFRKSGTEDFIQISAPISPGSSGGGLFDSTGKLIGITTGTLARGQNLNFAIPIGAYHQWKSRPTTFIPVVEGRQLTFKGTPLGATLDQFKANFGNSVCDLMGPITICTEQGVNFLNSTGRYQAFFQPNNLRFLKFSWLYSSDPVAKTEIFQKKIEEYFGTPTQTKDSIDQINDEIKVAIWRINEHQSIELSYCMGMSFVCTLGRGSFAVLQDKRFDPILNQPTRKERDF